MEFAWFLNQKHKTLQELFLNYSNVVYVGATPYCKKNLDYKIKQSKKFLEGKSPPDFSAEDYEINYKGRVKLEDLSLLAKKQLALEEWN